MTDPQSAALALSESHGRRQIHLVVAIYVLFGGLWILFSDLAAEALFDRPEDLIKVSLYKGWFFIAVTALLLYGLLRFSLRRLLAAQAGEAAQEAERKRTFELLYTLAESSEDAIFAEDLEGRYILFNAAGCRFVGLSPESVLGKDDYQVFPREQADFLAEIRHRILTHGQVEANEENLDTAVGKRIFQSLKGPLRDGDGRVIGMFGISRDITERKQASEDLAATLHAIPDLLFVVDETGLFLEVKATRLDLLLAPPEQLLGHRVGDVLPGAAVDTIMQALAAAGATGTDYGRVIKLDLADGEHEFELSVARKNTPPGQPGQFVVLSRDVTDRKRAERSIEESEARYRGLVEQSLAGIYIIQEGRFQYVNPAFAAIFGYATPETLIAEVTVADLVSPADRARVAENIRRRFAGEVDDLHYSFTGVRLDGGPVEVEVHGRVFEYQGRPAVIGMILDITGRRLAEDELRQRNQELERFNRASIGRELDMINLKKEVNALAEALGREPPYALAFLETVEAPDRAEDAA